MTQGKVPEDDGLVRCDWANTSFTAYREYHDREWGVPCHDERTLFELLILEGMQAGLSWSTVLKKRAAFREAFDGFDPGKMAVYGPEKIERLLSDPGIIRNRLKVEAAVGNARAYASLCERHGSLDSYLWSFADGRPIVNGWETTSQIPARTALSDEISGDLKHMGFRFAGSTIVYAWMQSVGVVNDHILPCAFRRA